MLTSSLDGVLGYLRRTTAPADSHSDAELLRRFVEQHDEVAFELLVWRHGRMVLGVCHRLLRQRQDAEDSFQVTFLTLARRAATITRHETVAGWLYRVAFHAAKATASLLKTEAERIDVQMQIAAALETAGDHTAATSTYREILDSVTKLKPDTDIKSINVYMLAVGLAERGEDERILRWLETQKSPEVKSRTLMGLAQGAVNRSAPKEGKPE